MNAGAAAGASAATAAAAAAAAARKREEEEEMTRYSREDLAEGWEFKILRSGLGAFKRPERLRQILEEESRAGWVLIEKFDDHRIRLRRSAEAKQRDPGLDLDPYRTSVPGETRRVLIYLGIGLLATIVVVAVLVLALAD